MADDPLRIAAAELRHLRMRLRDRFETSFGVEEERDCLLIRIEGAGEAGWGECVAGSFPGFSYETVGTAWHILADHLLPAVLDAPLVGISDLRARIAPIRGHPMAKAGLELAFWDWMGRIAKLPLVDLLGGRRTRVQVGVSVGIQPSVDALLKVVNSYLSQGYGRIKLKIKPGYDLEPVRAVRQSFPEVPLQVDGNGGYAPDQSAELLALDEFNLLLIEQPFAAEQLLAHARLQEGLRTPICLDESIGSEVEAQLALELGACRTINIKPGRVGGLSEAVAIHDLCVERGVPLWGGGMLETGVGRAGNLALAALPGFSLPADISATDRYYEQDIASPRFVLNSDSTIEVPAGPGLGVTIDSVELERVTLRSERFGAR
ncbi:MAG TPA: o-succinylbenzoate synthase [Anaerolineales bacterium]